MSRALRFSSEMVTVTLFLILYLEITATWATENFQYSINAEPAKLSSLLNIRRNKRETCLLTKGQFSLKDKIKLRRAHNDFRRNMTTPAAGMRRLDWKVHLAQRAQTLADTCVYQHDMLYDCNGKRMGQNLYMSWGVTVYPEVDPTAVVTAWHNEIIFYHLDTNECDAVCGHYKQVTWWNTQYFGCGIAYCPVLKHPGSTDKEKAVMVVCDYSPAGNYADGRPYTKGTPCSDCMEGTKCQRNLCIPIRR